MKTYLVAVLLLDDDENVQEALSEIPIVVCAKDENGLWEWFGAYKEREELGTNVTMRWSMFLTD